MGYDCTLHLVDETAIRDVFVPRLLGRSREPSALDRVMPNAAELWDQGRDALGGDDPETAASIVCQLAVTFSACSLPHQYERGFALSLWDGQPEDIAVEFPARFAFSPEPLFTAVVEAYPRLRGHFPTWFTGNYSTGVFIPSDRVPEVLGWVEARVAGFAKGDRRHFKGLLGILRAAADRGLAYWEATDLAVPMVGQFPGDPKLMIADYLENEPGAPGRQVEEAPLAGHFRSLGSHVVDGWLVSGDFGPFQTNFWDLSAWPPRLAHSLPEFAVSAARSRDGRWLLCSETDPQTKPRTFRPRQFADLAGEPVGTAPVVVDGKEMSVHAGGFVGGRPLVFRDPPSNAKVGDRLPVPLWLEGDRWVPIPGLPAAEARPSLLPHLVERPAVGLVRVADGGDVVVWDGDGYELRRKGFLRRPGFVKTFPMDARTSHVEWISAPAGDNGFYYLSGRRLFEVHRYGEPIPHVEKWTNIMAVGTGPEGSLILKEGDNQDGDVAKLYFPADGTFIHIEPELFDDKEYPFIHWSPRADRFVVLVGKFLAVPAAAVLSLPRYRVDTGRRANG